MSDLPEHTHEDYDMLAAEYVMGVQPANIRASLEKRIETDAEFASLVAKWEAHFAPLADTYETITPPPGLQASLEKRLFGKSNAIRKTSWWNGLALWRGLTFAAVAACAILLVRPMPAPSTQLVAPLVSEAGEVAFLALFNPETGIFRISQISAEKTDMQDFELWLIEADSVPLSLGVIDGQNRSEVTLSPADLARLSPGDTFAITLEPLGGSPLETATGPIIASGLSVSM